jgi:SAM-dependent methyltransferase
LLSVHRYHQISESTHLILNPLSIEKLALVEDICSPTPGQAVLDLGCGKGEMLCRFAQRFGTTGVGVDIHAPGIEQAEDRARVLGVADAVQFHLGDAAAFDTRGQRFDVVASIGTSWIGGGLVGTLGLMRAAAADDAWFLIGDVFWERAPVDAAALGTNTADEHGDLATTLAWIEGAGFDLVEIVVASPDDWDRYSASQWLNVHRWLADNPSDPEAGEVREWRDRSRRGYLADRGAMGWAVFVLKSSQS